MGEREVTFTVKLTFKSMDDELPETIEEMIDDDVNEMMRELELESALEDWEVKVEKVIPVRTCWNCDGKGVCLDRGDDAFWDCETCNGTGELDND
ncbi:hypothetical protein DIRTYBETTY_222 [Bacillus phage DirtyBetty]|uniref:Uncharacterized protein n=2 Tax=Wphvirus megatron TaxID=1987728 RepID=A0A1B1PAS2_9CAUD|nr:hypothetical protein QLX47_gp220 [Bacillus phage Eyuki]YP_009285164.1 hypothetical protein BIZ88_gp222 [Bacillus phage DirtyBetty]ALA46528.1 hypothetical protein EYUKI_220 [Bacillus phage Eyuki]ANT41258.1 hypothetical protein DIRTYBETTY_222 [Bacillus phage DirtyBetty]ASR79135.1 hypothetical protein ZAINNY_225 [Bacillus phage Zainny]